MRRVSATIMGTLTLVLGSCGSGDVATSHVEANVPPQNQLLSMLERDLLAYFSTLSSIRVTKVDVMLLRDGPTQTGVAYPKYYAWVILRSDSSETRSGAVRVAAVDNTHLEVTDFISRETLRSDPQAVSHVFPAALVADINRRALQ